ncbi:hypothetical protein D3C84_1060390 [compost metagenome]
MGPGAGEGNIQVIATGLRLETTFAARPGAAVGGDPVASLGILALEAAVNGGVVPLVMPASVNQQTHYPTPLALRLRRSV